jgi:hypothetical protein
MATILSPPEQRFTLRNVSRETYEPRVGTTPTRVGAGQQVTSHEAREEKRRQDEAERERQRLERLAASTAGPGAPRTSPRAQPPPDDGTLAYQQKLARWRATGEWPRGPW